MPDRTYKTQIFSFDNDNASPIVLNTKPGNGQYLLKRLFSINNVFTVNSSKNISMSTIKSTKTNLSNAGPMARPFDEFSTGIMMIPTAPSDEQSFDKTTQLCKDQ
ncbi:unnamed protein product [Rotaria magnacalcarata]|uniref:Uncharacterized protein n=2 Tax=Rotaria magnacalcarata TaxID=392030 RepID=A0A815Y8V6_9BILA|nr:unnamed protein product [Rotaria magnacalcarata]CAF2135042.1 unnamed protein product [Rotaria magnacalcarata]CAF3908361.1 unnamed protein product [Rotaria magnacalcarata]CAF5173126.1 unnamed protein product [Rotaria magnacalcarata]